MITVELHEAPGGPGDYRKVATLTVADDGTYHFDDPDRMFPTSLYVLVPGEQLRQVRFEEDPALWARNLHTLLRSGYLVPVVTRDDAGS